MNNITPKIESTNDTSAMQKNTSSATTAKTSDPFLAIINRTIANMEETQQSDVKSQLEQPETLALLAQFFAQMSSLSQEETQQVDANITNIAIDFEQLKNFMTQNNIQIPQVLQELSAQQNPQIQNANQLLQGENKIVQFENLVTTDLTSNQEQNTNVISFSAQSSSASSAEEQLFTGQHDFFKSIEAVKKDMQPQNTADIEAILAQLNAQQEVSSTQATQAAQTQATGFQLPVNNPELFNQLQVGLQEGVDANLPEFTLKLNPQELGEITVKLFNEGGKQVLEIVAASSKTSLLINDDLDALRQAMAPLQIEVKEAVVTSAAQAGQSQMHDFNMNNQQFANRENQSQQTSQSYAYNGEHPQEEEQAIQQTLVDDTLSMYI